MSVQNSRDANRAWHVMTSQCCFTSFSASSRSAMTSKSNAKMSGFFWTVFALFVILQPTAETHKTVEEEEEHTSRTHHHRASSLQMDIERQQKQLTKTLQNFLEEYKNLYKMAEHLKKGEDPGDSNENHFEDESHGMSGNDEHQSYSMNKNPSRHDKHASTTTEHDEHHHQRKIHDSEETIKEDHVTPYEGSDGYEQLGHSGQGEHSGEHEGQTENGVHLKNGEKHKIKKEIEQMEKKAHKTGNHGDSQRVKKDTAETQEIEQMERESHKAGNNGEEETEEAHEIEQMEKEVHETGNHGNKYAEKIHEEDHVTRFENSVGENSGDKQIFYSGEGEHSGGHDKRPHGNHGDGHRDEETKEMHEIERMEKEAHRRGNHGDGHRDEETKEMHEIEQMEKEAHKTVKGDDHGGMKIHTSDIHHINHKKQKALKKVHEVDEMEHGTHLKNSARHFKEKQDNLEHREEAEIEGDTDHDIDRYNDGYHRGYEAEHIKERYHMDTSLEDDGDDSHGHGEVDSYSYERKRRVSRDNDDNDHETDGHQGSSRGRKKYHTSTHDNNLHHIPMSHERRDHRDTHRDNDDSHHGTEGHKGSSHKRNEHHMATHGDELHHKNKRQAKVLHHMSAREDDADDWHHGNSNDDSVHRSSRGRPESSRHRTRGHHAGHVDASSHKRESPHALDRVSAGNDVQHGHSSRHDKKLHPNLDDTHTEIHSHQQKIDNHHMDTRIDNDMHHGIKGHVKMSLHQQPQLHHLDKKHEKHRKPHQHHRTRRQAPSNDDDIFIEEVNNGKKELYTAIFTNDDEMHNDDGGDDASRTFLIAGMKRQKSQSAPDCRAVADQTFVYDKDNCRLCRCIKGNAQCETRPKSCSDKLDNMCSFINGEVVVEGTPHYDGCNYCVCRKRQWVCTRLRCYFAQHDYVNYASLKELTSGIERHIDTCMECDREPVTPVCGPDWRTYRSLCHARFCGNYDVDEIIQGPCSRTNPCENAKCAADETCVSFPRGPCLSTKTRDDHSVECKQYKCVSTKAECPDDTLPGDVVCGEDGQTYPSECHLVQKSVVFAYRGPCRVSCRTGKTQVCGTDGVPYQSDCHANLLSRHVDYPGACENPVAKPEVVNMDDGSFQYVNRRCRKVHESKRCLYPTCTSTVIPEGSCCPVCGAAVSIRIDRDIASDLLELPLLKPSMELASLETIQAFIRRIQDPQHLRKCRMTIDYTERNDLSVLFTPRQPGYIIFCQKAAQDTMEYINMHSNSSDPIEAMLAAAVAVETGATPINSPTRVKRNVNLDLVRIRRSGEHHEHHMFNSTSSGVTPSLGMLFSIGAFTNLYWFTTESLLF